MNDTTIRRNADQPQLGVLFLGRKRPGFDPEWGALMKRQIRSFVEHSGYPVTIPSDNIADDHGLREAIETCRRAGVTVLVVCQPTISDGRFAPILAQLWERPLVLWANPEKQTGAMISSNSLVGSHVFAATLRQLGFRFELLIGAPDSEGFEAEFRRTVRLVDTAVRLHGSKYGFVGYHAPGFIDLQPDAADLSRLLGVQLYHQSVGEFMGLLESIEPAAIEADLAQVEALGLPARGVDRSALPLQSKFYLALRRLMEEESLAGVGMRCWPDLPELTGQWPYLAAARLAEERAAVVPEGDVDGAIGINLVQGIADGPVYISDWLEHTRRQVTIWHTGSPPFALCDAIGRETGPTLALHFNNKKPTVVEATIRAGIEGTLYRMWRCDGRYHLAAFEGSTVAPARHLLGVNGVFESESVDISEWFDEMVHAGMPHHVGLVAGRHARELRRLARLLDLEWHQL